MVGGCSTRLLGDQVPVGIDFAAGLVDIHVHAVTAGLFRAALPGRVFGSFKVIGLVVQGHLAVVLHAVFKGFDVDQAPVDGFQVAQALVGNGDMAVEAGDGRQHVPENVGGEKLDFVYGYEQVTGAFAAPVHARRRLQQAQQEYLGGAFDNRVGRRRAYVQDGVLP